MSKPESKNWFKYVVQTSIDVYIYIYMYIHIVGVKMPYNSLFLSIFGGCGVHKTCLFHLLGVCFEEVRNSSLLLSCCHFVVLMFGQEPSFSPAFLVCLHSFD